MRTTLNLDDDVANRLTDSARTSGRSISRVANDILRAGFMATKRRPKLEPYNMPVFDTGVPLIDVTEIAEALETLDRA